MTTRLQQGSHFVRCGVEGLGGELQRRGIARHASWGARGIVLVFSVSLTLRHANSILEIILPPIWTPELNFR